MNRVNGTYQGASGIVPGIVSKHPSVSQYAVAIQGISADAEESHLRKRWCEIQDIVKALGQLLDLQQNPCLLIYLEKQLEKHIKNTQ